MYLANAFAPRRSGLAAVWYDSGAESHLSGLNAVAYDNGGRLRMLLGQDPSVDMPPPDVGVEPAIPTGPMPIDMFPVSPTPMLPYTPSPVVDTVATDITGSLIPPAQQAAPISGTILTDILNAAKTIVPLAAGVSSGGGTVPKTAGTVVTTGPGASTAAASWTGSLTQSLPTIAIVGGVALVGLVLLGSLSGGGGGSRRRRNPAELILMGANPAFSKKRHDIKRALRARAIKRQLRSMGVKVPRKYRGASALDLYSLRQLRKAT